MNNLNANQPLLTHSQPNIVDQTRNYSNCDPKIKYCIESLYTQFPKDDVDKVYQTFVDYHIGWVATKEIPANTELSIESFQDFIDCYSPNTFNSDANPFCGKSIMFEKIEHIINSDLHTRAVVRPLQDN